MNLILIRHAESRHIVDHIISGPKSCKGLTSVGFTQAQALADRIRRTGEMAETTLILTSPYLRTRQTADAIAVVLTKAKLIEDSDLSGMLPGEADGLSGSEYEARYGRYDRFLEPDRPLSPGGESWNEYSGRVWKSLDLIASAYDGQTVIAVTHAEYIVVATLMLLDTLGRKKRAWIDPSFTGITEWLVTGEKWVLVRYNDCAHLMPAPTMGPPGSGPAV